MYCRKIMTSNTFNWFAIFVCYIVIDTDDQIY